MSGLWPGAARCRTGEVPARPCIWYGRGPGQVRQGLGRTVCDGSYVRTDRANAVDAAARWRAVLVRCGMRHTTSPGKSALQASSGRWAVSAAVVSGPVSVGPWLVRTFRRRRGRSHADALEW